MIAGHLKIIIVLIFFLAGCSENAGERSLHCGKLNMAHLDHLFANVRLENGNEAGIVHIYSEYPGYNFTIEPEQGFSCVDDVARAAVLLSNCPENITARNTRLDMMINFLLYMQSDNGYFYNFIWHDGSINKTYRTSVAEPDWWSWRAFWALEEYAALNEANARKIGPASHKLSEAIFRDLLNDDRSVSDAAGLCIPTWLPGKAAADQSGDLILALVKYYRRTKDDRATKLIDQLATGILLMQAGDSLNFPYGAFLSWNNTWHAYGNIQSYALLKAGELLNNPTYIERALMEVDHFYPWLIKNGYLNYFNIQGNDGKYEVTAEEKFPQIAYGIRPVIYSSTEAYRITGKEKYLDLARLAAGWLAGSNPAGKVMFDPSTGRGYDGIINNSEINLNSGAESTIEALLALQALEKLGIDIKEFYSNRTIEQSSNRTIEQ